MPRVQMQEVLPWVCKYWWWDCLIPWLFSYIVEINSHARLFGRYCFDRFWLLILASHLSSQKQAT